MSRRRWVVAVPFVAWLIGHQRLQSWTDRRMGAALGLSASWWGKLRRGRGQAGRKTTVSAFATFPEAFAGDVAAGKEE